MKIYDAKIFLKPEISQEECINLFLSWIYNSKNYDSKGLARSYQEISGEIYSKGYKYNNSNIMLSLKCAVDSQGCL